MDAVVVDIAKPPLEKHRIDFVSADLHLSRLPDYFRKKIQAAIHADRVIVGQPVLEIDMFGAVTAPPCVFIAKMPFGGIPVSVCHELKEGNVETPSIVGHQRG